LIGCLAGGCGFGSVDCELIRDTQFLPLRRWRTRGRSSESGQRQEIGRGVCSTSWLQRIGTGGARPPRATGAQCGDVNDIDSFDHRRRPGRRASRPSWAPPVW